MLCLDIACSMPLAPPRPTLQRGPMLPCTRLKPLMALAQYIAPIFTGCPSKDTRLVEIQQTAAAAHAQLISYSKQARMPSFALFVLVIA